MLLMLLLWPLMVAIHRRLLCKAVFFKASIGMASRILRLEQKSETGTMSTEALPLWMHSSTEICQSYHTSGSETVIEIKFPASWEYSENTTCNFGGPNNLHKLQMKQWETLHVRRPQTAPGFPIAWPRRDLGISTGLQPQAASKTQHITYKCFMT